MAANSDTTPSIPSSREARPSGADDDSSGPKKPEGPPFRCPLYAARGVEGSRRCKDWRNVSIAAVTRHALTDAGEGTEKRQAIRELSSMKLAPQERWRRYYVIFNDDVEDAPMNQPYWLSVEPSDAFQALANIFTHPTQDGTRALEFAMALGDLEAERKKNIESIDSEYDGREVAEVAALRTSLLRDKLHAKQQVQTTYQAQIDALKNRFAEQGTTARADSPRQDNSTITGPEDGVVAVYSTGRSQRNRLSTLIQYRASLAATANDPAAEQEEQDHPGEQTERSPQRKRTWTTAHGQQQSQREQHFAANVLEMWNDFVRGYSSPRGVRHEGRVDSAPQSEQEES